MVSYVKNILRQAHGDTRGAMSVEKILILALIALPILVLLLAFRRTIVDWFTEQRDQLRP